MMKHKLAFTFLCILITACANQTANSQINTPQATSTSENRSSPVLHFPQQVNTPDAYMAALIGGQLVLINGCLRVQEPDGLSILLIWRPGFSTRIENGVVQIIDNTGQVTASVGDFVEVGGGFDDNPTWMDLTEPLTEDCPGPYWIVGEWIRKIDASLGIHFPQLVSPQSTSTQTAVKGDLVLENGCLRLNVVDEDSFLLIWNRRFSTSTEQDVVQVVDSETNKPIVSTGDFVEVVGGVIDDPIGWGMIAPLPSECPGPYFLVGGSIRKIDRP